MDLIVWKNIILYFCIFLSNYSNFASSKMFAQWARRVSKHLFIMRRFWYLFLFIVSWLGCFSQNAVKITSETFSDVIQIQDDVDLQFLGVDNVSEVTKDDPELIEATIEDSLGEQPGFIDYKETKYWRRYKALRTAGWVCFGCGAGFLVGGYALIFAAFISSNSSVAAGALGITGGLMFFSSPLLIVASVPLLATAYYNRHKAKKLNFNIGVSQIPSMTASPLAMKTPAVSFSLEF